MTLARVFCGISAAEVAPWLTVAVVDDAGRLLDLRHLSDDPAGYAQLGGLLADRSTGVTPVALDRGDHLIGQLLAAARQPLTIAEHGAVTDFAERFSDDTSYDENRAPMDQRCAVGLARALQAGALYAHIQNPAIDLDELKPVLGAHAAIAAGRQAAATALREVLRELYPAALRAYPDPAEFIPLKVLDALPEPGLLTASPSSRQRESALVADLAASGVTDAQTAMNAISALRASVEEAPRWGNVRMLAPVVAETVRQAVAAVRAADAASAALVSALVERLGQLRSGQGPARPYLASSAPVSPAPRRVPGPAAEVPASRVAPRVSSASAAAAGVSVAAPPTIPAPRSAPRSSEWAAEYPGGYGYAGNTGEQQPYAYRDEPSYRDDTYAADSYSPGSYREEPYRDQSYREEQQQQYAYSGDHAYGESAYPYQGGDSSYTPSYAPEPEPEPHWSDRSERSGYGAERRREAPPAPAASMPPPAAATMSPVGMPPAATHQPPAPERSYDEMVTTLSFSRDPLTAPLGPPPSGTASGPPSPRPATPANGGWQDSRFPSEPPAARTAPPSRPDPLTDPLPGQNGTGSYGSSEGSAPNGSYGPGVNGSYGSNGSHSAPPPPANGGYGYGQNGGSYASTPAPSHGSSRPTNGAAADDDLLIFSQTQSAWFTFVPEEGLPEPPTWDGLADDGWRAAEQLTHPTVGDATMAGLPRRVPQANLVPGSAATQKPQLRIVRDAQSIAAHTDGYFRGWRRGQEIGGYAVGQRDRAAWEFNRDQRARLS